MDHLRAAVEGAGYTVPEASPGEDPVARQERTQREEERALLTRLRVGVVLGVPLLLLSHWELFAGHGGLPVSPVILAFVQFLLATPIQFYVGARFYRAAWVVARHGSTDMNTLVVLGTSVAYLYSGIAAFFPSLVTAEGLAVHLYFETSAAIIVLVLLGRYFESRARGKTSEAVKKLIGLAPKTARVVRERCRGGRAPGVGRRRRACGGPAGGEGAGRRDGRGGPLRGRRVDADRRADPGR